MSNICEDFIGSLTVGRFAESLGISVDKLIDVVMPPSTTVPRRHEALVQHPIPAEPVKAPKPSAKPQGKVQQAVSSPSAATRKGELGNLMGEPARKALDTSILRQLNANGEMRIDPLMKALPWSNLDRKQLGRALARLIEQGKVFGAGNTQARVYAFVSN